MDIYISNKIIKYECGNTGTTWFPPNNTVLQVNILALFQY